MRGRKGLKHGRGGNCLLDGGVFGEKQDVVEEVENLLSVGGPTIHEPLVRRKGRERGTDFVKGPDTRMIAIAERPGGVDKA